MNGISMSNCQENSDLHETNAVLVFLLLWVLNFSAITVR